MRFGGSVIRMWMAALVAVVVLADAAVAAPPAPPGGGRRPGGPGGPGGGRFDPAQMREFLVRQASEYYGLDDKQKESFKALLEERSEGARAKWEAVGKLFNEAREAARNGERVDWDAVREKSRPAMEEARKFTEETTGLFRDKVLTDEQKKKFDEAKTKGLDPISGREQGGRFGQGGPGGQTDRVSRRFTGMGFEEQAWAAWLERLNTAAKLSEEQLGKAKDMLALAKEAAADYRKSKEAEYKRLAEAFGEIAKDRNFPREKRDAIVKEGTELTAPIDGIEKKWKDDVKTLLNDEQKKAAETLDRQRGGRGQGGQPGQPGAARRPGNNDA